MLFRLLALQLVFLGLLSYADCRGRADPYDYHLVAEHELFTGHISHDAEKGAKIKAEAEEPEGHTGGEGSNEGFYLKVLIQHAEKSLPPQKQTSAKSFDITMVTEPQTKGQVTRDNTKVASNTFNQVPTHTQRMTGPQVSAVQNTGSDVSPVAQKFTTDTRVVNTSADLELSSDTTEDKVTVVTRPHGPTADQGSRSHNIHLTGGNRPTDSTVKMNQRFRNVLPHGHNIHITHLVHDPVHPAVNKRSVDGQFDKMLHQERKLRHRNRRNFAVPPEDFQPLHLQQTTTKAPPKLVVKETNAFIVDPVDNYIRVNDTSQIRDHKLIQFYVVLEDEEGTVASNPLPFIVHIDQPEESDSYPLGAAVFAGVLVLCVVFLALFIPLVTRAKRRYKEGKPMFKLGSHPSRADLDKAALENQTNIARKASEPNWYGNNIFYNYEDEIARERLEFTKGLRQYSTKSEPPTLQLHNKKKGALSDSSSSSGIDSASQGANGFDGEDTYDQRL